MSVTQINTRKWLSVGWASIRGDDRETGGVWFKFRCCPPRHSVLFCASSRHLKSAPADTGGTRNVRTRWFRVPGRCFRSFPLVQTRVLRSRADFLRIMAFCIGCIGPVILYGPFGWDKSPVSQRRMREWRELAQESPECHGGQHGRKLRPRKSLD